MGFIRTCDRCQTPQEDQRTAMERAEGWSGIVLVVREKHMHAPNRLASNKYQYELCAGCTFEFRKFLGTDK